MAADGIALNVVVDDDAAAAAAADAAADADTEVDAAAAELAAAELARINLASTSWEKYQFPSKLRRPHKPHQPHSRPHTRSHSRPHSPIRRPRDAGLPKCQEVAQDDLMKFVRHCVTVAVVILVFCFLFTIGEIGAAFYLAKKVIR